MSATCSRRRLVVASALLLALVTMLPPPVSAAIPRRGLYVSIDTTYASAADTRYDDLLGFPDRQDIFLQYCRQRGFDSVSLYDLQRVLPARAGALRAMVWRFRRGGIRFVEAIGGRANWAWRDIVDYNKGCTNDDEMFDGVITEIEYWHTASPKNVTEMLAPVWYARSLNPIGRTDPVTGVRRPFYFAAYIGWPDVGQIDTEMAASFDVIFMHAYRATPNDAYAYTRIRISELLANSSLTVSVIYSSEGTTNSSAVLNPFMGNWLASSMNNTVQLAESMYMEPFEAAWPLKAANATRFWGFQWFHYYYSGHYDTEHTSKGPWLNASVSWPLVRPGAEWQNLAWCGEHQGTYTRCQDTALVNMSHDVVFVDMFDTSAATIASLKPRIRAVNSTSTTSLPNRTVVCYYSAGTWENWRVDIGNFTSGALRGPMGSWPGEQWLDIFNTTAVEQEIKPAMAWRLDLAKSKGCDAVEPDNVDCWQNSACLLTADEATGRAAQLAYNKWTATAAHSRGLAVGLKNDLDQIPLLIDDYDFAVNENCHQYSECHTLLPFLRADKAVFRTEYTSTLEQVCNDQDSLKMGPLHSTMRAVDGLWVPCTQRPLNLSTSIGTDGGGAVPPAPTTSPAPTGPTTPAGLTTTAAPGATASGAASGTAGPSPTPTPPPATFGAGTSAPPVATPSPGSGQQNPGGVGGSRPRGNATVSDGCDASSCGGFVAVVVVAAIAVGAVAVGVCVLVAKR